MNWIEILLTFIPIIAIGTTYLIVNITDRNKVKSQNDFEFRLMKEIDKAQQSMYDKFHIIEEEVEREELNELIDNVSNKLRDESVNHP